MKTETITADLDVLSNIDTDGPNVTITIKITDLPMPVVNYLQDNVEEINSEILRALFRALGAQQITEVEAKIQKFFDGKQVN